LQHRECFCFENGISELKDRTTKVNKNQNDLRIVVLALQEAYKFANTKA